MTEGGPSEAVNSHVAAAMGLGPTAGLANLLGGVAAAGGAASAAGLTANQKNQMGCSVHVGNLSTFVTEEVLRQVGAYPTPSSRL